MKYSYILASIAIVGVSEAAPVKRGLLDDLFGLSSTTTPAAAVPATTPTVAAAQAPATTSSTGGFWANLFNFNSQSTTQAAAVAAVTTPAAAVQAVTTPAATTSRGFLAGLFDDLFDNNAATTTTPTTAPAAQAPVVAATSTQPTAVAATPTLAAVPTTSAAVIASQPSTAAIGRTAEDLWDFFFGGSSSSNAQPVVASSPSSATSAAAIIPSVSSAGSVNSLNSNAAASTLGTAFQGGSPGKYTGSINTATATAINGGSTDGAEVAAGALGITYSPYTKSDGCKSAQEVASDIAKLSSYEVIRLYGTDCSGIENVLSAMGSNQKLFLGVWNVGTPTNELSNIVNAINSSKQGWSVVHTIAIGNERVNAGAFTVQQMQTAVDQSRQYLKQNAPSYTGPIVTVDTLVAYLANPQLCQMSDYLAVNSHPYWDGGVQPSDSGPWLEQQIAHLQSVCGSSKEVLITETGWPTQGDTYGQCVPSVANQVAAVKSINQSIGPKTIMFTMYNDYWKDPGPYNVEQHWGLYGDPSE